MLTPTVFELTFDTDKNADFQAGQFISIVIPGAGPGGRNLRRAYSFASEPSARPIELCIKVVEDGPGVTYLYALRPGDTFVGGAPFGDFVYQTSPDRRAFFIATGTGVAPFRSMLGSRHYRDRPPMSATLLLGVRSEEELLYVGDFEQFPDLAWIPAVSRPSADWKGFRGRVTDYVRTLGTNFPWLETDFYLCGGAEMLKEMKSILESRGVQKDFIHSEKYF